MMDNPMMKETNKWSEIKRTILTNMIIIPFIPFILAVSVSFYYFTTSLENSTTASLKRIVSDHRDMIESFLMDRKADLEFVTNSFSFDQINNKNAIEGLFENLNKKSNAFVDLGLFDSKGIHVQYSGPYDLQGKNYADELWFKKVIEQGYYISDIFLGYRNVPHFIIAVMQSTGDKTWVLRTTIDTLSFDWMISEVRIGKTGEAYILNRDGISQTQRRSSGVNVMEIDPDFKNFPVSDNKINTFIRTDSSKTQYLYATTWLKNWEWLLVVRQEKNDAYRFLNTAYFIILIITIIGGAVIVVVAVFSTKRVVRQIEELDQEKKNLGNQLVRAAKLAEIGEMTAGFAHEINNPLQIIKSEHSLIQMLLKEVFSKIDYQDKQDIDDINESLDQIMLQINRCSDITYAILKFGRKSEISRQTLQPSLIIPEIVRMIEKKAALNSIEIITHFSEQSPDFIGDPSQFQQVILNLLNNAMDAITERHGSKGGTIEIETDLKNEQFLVIKITDNGIGISKENITKIFSPFYTTKPVGKGTGLGLSVCFGIIESFGGTVEVLSEQNVGTSFIISLPAINR